MSALTRAAYACGFRLAVITAAVCLFSPAMFGENLAAPCTPGTVSVYVRMAAAGDECSIGILNIDSFSFSSSPSAPLSAANIEVSPFSDGLSGGLTFCVVVAAGDPCTQATEVPDGFSVMAGSTADYEIDYEELVDSGPAVTGSDMDMDPPFGDVTITQNLCADEFLIGSGSDESCEVTTIDPPVQSFSIDVASPSNHLDLMQPATVRLGVSNLIDLNSMSTATASGFDSFTTQQDVAIVGPEPAPFVLALTGFLGLGFRLRSKRRAKV